MSVLVIGSGMAGTAAALAARAVGAEVLVVSAGQGATAFSSGVTWPGEGDEPPAGFVAAEAGVVFANVMGELVPARFAQAAQLAGAIHPGQRVAIVGLRDSPQLLDVIWASDELRGKGVAVGPPRELALPLSVEQTRRSPFEWARVLDQNEAELTRFAEGLRQLLDDELLLLPPMMGFEPSTFERLAKLVAAPVGELCASMPSVPGLRLARHLEAKLREAGCAYRQAEVVQLEVNAAELEGGERLAFGAVVLATGQALGARPLELTVDEDEAPWLLDARPSNTQGLDDAWTSGTFAGRAAAELVQRLANEGKPA